MSLTVSGSEILGSCKHSKIVCIKANFKLCSCDVNSVKCVSGSMKIAKSDGEIGQPCHVLQ